MERIQLTEEEASELSNLFDLAFKKIKAPPLDRVEFERANKLDPLVRDARSKKAIDLSHSQASELLELLELGLDGLNAKLKEKDLRHNEDLYRGLREKLSNVKSSLVGKPFV